MIPVTDYRIDQNNMLGACNDRIASLWYNRFIPPSRALIDRDLTILHSWAVLQPSLLPRMLGVAHTMGRLYNFLSSIQGALNIGLVLNNITPYSNIFNCYKIFRNPVELVEDDNYQMSDTKLYDMVNQFIFELILRKDDIEKAKHVRLAALHLRHLFSPHFLGGTLNGCMHYTFEDSNGRLHTPP
jgi:hypothetical protein